MTSWRDTASLQTQADLDGLLNVVMPFAERMLAVITSMYDAVRGSARLRAVVLAADVRVGEADAVRVDLEHVEGEALAALFPYVRDDETTEVTFGEPTAVEADRRIWP